MIVYQTNSYLFNYNNSQGFDCTEKNFDNKMFFMLECKKSSQSCSIDPNYTAKVCMYKKR